MKRFFLIPLLTLMCSVMAWGTTYQVGTYAQLKAALEAGDATLIELTADITYDGAWKTVKTNNLNDATTVENALCIKNSLTLDGKGHKLNGWGKHKLLGNESESHRTTLAIHPESNEANIEVTIKNLSLGNQTLNKRYYGILAFDGVAKLTYDNVYIDCGDYSAQQPICFTGTDATPIALTVKDSYVNSGNGAYPFYVLKPISATLTNTMFEGWCSLYFKYRNTPVYGAVVGARGSSVIAENCTFKTMNVHHGTTNGFAVFPIEDDGITLDLRNCSMNAEQFTETNQSLISLQYKTRTSGFQKVSVSISGDNTHIYNVDINTLALTGWNTNDDDYPTTYVPKINVPFEFNISGGTFTVDPRNIEYHTYVDGSTFGVEHPFIDPTKYEVKEISQGGTIVWRVVPKTTTLYDLNDNVQSQGDGQNPTTSFELSDGSAMTLNQEITKAGYVEVKDHATEGATTVTVAKNDINPEQSQTLVINNGLDVQGESQVIVEPTAALVIGEGGIVTSKPENIIINADEDGAASLLLDPTITVNQTPELTVKMTVPAEHAGYEMLGSDKYRHWFRFAMPVEHMAATWAKEPNVPTYLYGWDYSAQAWEQVGVTEMVPFAGYTLSPDKEISTNTAVTYTFKGKLLGNTNCKLELDHHGYNFFGNSYTGYISILKLVEQIMGDTKIDGTVWMWDGETYQGVALAGLEERPYLYESWQKEVAPMQTFVLRLTGSDFSSTDINYADAIWGNPRYDAAKTALNAAPARPAAINDNAIIRMSISANGQKESIVLIENGVYSDAYDRGYDAIKYMNENCFNTYVGVNGENYGTVATDNLDGKMLSIKTNNELAYTMTFDFVAGEEYALRDNLTGKVIAIEEDATYEFAAQPNSTVEGRFEIIALAKVPTAIENAEVKANVKGIYTITGQYVGEDFEAVPAGVYVVNGVKIVK